MHTGDYQPLFGSVVAAFHHLMQSPLNPRQPILKPCEHMRVFYDFAVGVGEVVVDSQIQTDLTLAFCSYTTRLFDAEYCEPLVRIAPLDYDLLDFTRDFTVHLQRNITNLR